MTIYRNYPIQFDIMDTLEDKYSRCVVVYQKTNYEIMKNAVVEFLETLVYECEKNVPEHLKQIKTFNDISTWHYFENNNSTITNNIKWFMHRVGKVNGIKYNNYFSKGFEDSNGDFVTYQKFIKDVKKQMVSDGVLERA